MIGDRLKLARAKSGLSLRDLSEKMGNIVTAQALWKYEHNKDVPSSDVLIALSKALGVTVGYLMDASGVTLSNVDFRAAAAARLRDRAHVQTEVLEAIERYLQIETVLELDSAKWHTPLDRPRKLGDPDQAEKLADDVRDAWNLGSDPIPNMTELLEEKGLKVLTLDLPDRISGFTCMVQRPDLPELPVVVVNRKKSLERRRVTLAHELAHRLIDGAKLSVRELEKAANVFAGAFLMPKARLLEEVGKQRHALGYQELITLKHLYQVSGAALVVRLRQIGVISEAVLIYAFQNVARGWRTEEPEPLEPPEIRGELEKARRFDRLCYRALAEGLISLVKGAELLRRPVNQVEAGLKGPRKADAPHHFR